jgi:hypothetical protein
MARWRIMQSLGVKSPWFDPYNQNALKGDIPMSGDWFVNLGVVSDTLTPRGVRLRYIQCPQAPFNGTSEENVCAGI